MNFSKLIAGLLILLLSLTKGFSQKPAKIKFERQRSMPGNRYAMAYTTDGIWIYSIGGRDESARYMNTIFAYHTALNRWDNFRLGRRFSKRGFSNATHSKGLNSILLTGGIYGSVNNTAFLLPDIELFDLKTKRIRVIAKNKHPAKKCGVVLTNEIIYIFGGSTGGNSSYSNELHAYNLMEKGWRELAPMPQAKEVDGIHYHDKIYTFGGYDGNPHSEIHSYDIKTNSWTFEGNLPLNYSSYGLAKYENYVFLIGDYKASNSMIIYDLDENVSYLYRTNIPGRHIGAVVQNGKLYVFGGNEAGVPFTVNKGLWVLDLTIFFNEQDPPVYGP